MPRTVVAVLYVFALAGVAACGTRDTTVGFRTSGGQPCGSAFTVLTGAKVSLSAARKLDNARIALIAGLDDDRVYLALDEAGSILAGPHRLGGAVGLNAPSLALSSGRMVTSFSNHALRGRWTIFAYEFDPANPSMNWASTAVEISTPEPGENLGPRLAASDTGYGIAYRHVQNLEFSATGPDLKPLGHGSLSRCSGLPKVHGVVSFPPDSFGVLNQCSGLQALDVFSAVDGHHVERRFERRGVTAALSSNAQGFVVTWVSNTTPQATMETLDARGAPIAGTEKTFDLAASASEVAVAHSAAGDAALYVGSDASLHVAWLPASASTARTNLILGTADVENPPALFTTSPGFLALWTPPDERTVRAQVLCP
ncbi:MAG: hypothetical protein KA712_24315 [Myxococcales bacterium]|nr:hypothetical protein [Myxococcales bacterium]